MTDTGQNQCYSNSGKMTWPSPGQAFNEFNDAQQLFSGILGDDHRLLPETELWRVHLGLGYVHLKQGNFEKAAQMFEKARNLSSNSDTLKASGIAAYKNKAYLDALDFLYCGLGWISLKQKKYDAAENWFEKAITIDPSYLDAHTGKKSLETILSAAALRAPEQDQ